MKKIWKSDHKIGVEVEYYANHIKQLPLHTTQCTDCSLLNNGHELKFDKGYPLHKAYDILKSMNKYFNEYGTGNKKARFISRERTLAFDNKCKHTIGRDGFTGLHVHFDASHMTKYDKIRLVALCSRNNSKIISLGGRKNNNWSQHMRIYYKTVLHNAIMYNHLVGPSKDYGLVINCHYNTVEFRYADASLITDMGALEKYISYLKYLVDKATTGEESAKLGTLIINNSACNSRAVVTDTRTNKKYKVYTDW